MPKLSTIMAGAFQCMVFSARSLDNLVLHGFSLSNNATVLEFVRYVPDVILQC